MNKFYRYFKYSIAFAVFFVALLACANIGNPEGGPYDMTPPRLLEAYPKTKALNVKDKSFKLKFSEYVKLVKQSEKVIVSPPQKTPARFTIDGKSIRIHLEDTLAKNKTYSIYFDDAVVDNNEDNPIEHFSYTFSTGDHIDSMQLIGQVLDARTLEPVPALLVGAYLSDNLNDSTFYQVPFPSATKSNKMGKFTIRGLQDSVFSVFAIQDNDNNFHLSKGGEGLAFIDEKFKTSLLDSMRTDTIRIDSIVRRDTIHRDSLVTYPYTYYSPDDIILRYFMPKHTKCGLERYDRIDSAKFQVKFMSILDTLPQLHLINKGALDDVLYSSVEGESLTCWLKDSTLMNLDSIAFSLSYGKTDSLGIKHNVLDTLTFYKLKDRKKKKKKKTEEKTPLLSVHSSKGIYARTPKDSLYILTTEPLLAFPKEGLSLSATKGKDSIATDQPFVIEQDKLNILKYNVIFPKAYDTKYALKIDSSAIHSFYGKACDSLDFSLDISPEAELANLEVVIVGLDSLIQVELLDQQGKVLLQESAISLRDSTILKGFQSDKGQKGASQDPMLANLLKKQAKQSKSKQKSSLDSLALLKEEKLRSSKHKCLVRFRDLKPQNYYLRLFVDSNADGEWTTGEYPNRQPEEVYYCPKEFELKKGITQKEEWLVFALPLNEQKPLKIRKVKPEKKKKRIDKNIEYYKRLGGRKKK